MNPTFLQVAMSKLSPFRNQAQSSQQGLRLARELAAVTGIPLPLIMRAERRMAQTGSLAPLRELLMDPERRRSERLSFKMRLRHLHKGKATAHELVSSWLTLDIDTVRGALHVVVKMDVERQRCQSDALLQLANIQIAYRVKSQDTVRCYRQQVSIGASAPAVAQPQVRIVAAHAA